MRTWNAMAVVAVAAAIGTVHCTSGVTSDVRKYANIVCEEMRDPEVSCIRGQRGSDTLASGLVASQIVACNMQLAMAALQGGDSPECETTAQKHGLSISRFITMDQEMRLRCGSGDGEACTIACCGEDRPIQAMPMLGIPGMR